MINSPFIPLGRRNLKVDIMNNQGGYHSPYKKTTPQAGLVSCNLISDMQGSGGFRLGQRIVIRQDGLRITDVLYEITGEPNEGATQPTKNN